MPRDGLLNQDLRDHICEFAVSDVATACAVRSVGRGWRLAADRRIRNLVAMGQPQIVPEAPPSTHQTGGGDGDRGTAAEVRPPLVLNASEHCDQLDDLRLVLSCDDIDNVLRVAIVAFALEGAKDHESDEPAWCGPRELCVRGHFSVSRQLLHCTVGEYSAYDDGPPPDDWTQQPAVARRAHSCLANKDLLINPDKVSEVLKAYDAGLWLTCPTDLVLETGAVEDATCIDAATRFASSVTYLSVHVSTKKRLSAAASDLLRSFKNVTELVLDFGAGDPRSALALGASLGVGDSDDESEGGEDTASAVEERLTHLFGVLLASGAPIKKIEVFELDYPRILARFVNDLPSLTSIEFSTVDNETDWFYKDLTNALWRDARARLTRFDPSFGTQSPLLCTSGFTSLRKVKIDTENVFAARSDQSKWWDEDQGPRNSLTTLEVAARDPLPLATCFRDLFRNITKLTIRCTSDAVSRLDYLTPGLPPCLRTLELFSVTHFTAWLTKSLTMDVGCDGTPIPAIEDAAMVYVDDVSGLLPTAGSICDLRVCDGKTPTAHVPELVRACAPNLTDLSVPHPQALTRSDGCGALSLPALRQLKVISDDCAPAVMETIVRESKRLHLIDVAGDEIEALSEADGWRRDRSFGSGVVVATRRSFM